MRVATGAAALAVTALVFGDVAVVGAADRARRTADAGVGGSPFGTLADPGDPAKVTMPALAFKDDGTMAADFDKYYAFRRADTDFRTAYADIAECDGYARGLQSGDRLRADALSLCRYDGGRGRRGARQRHGGMIFGSGEKRRMRRVNMRTCMNFKGYDRYGLSKDVWDTFNFEEGLSGVSEDKRQVYLKQQALVASSGTLQGKALGL